MYEVMKLIMRGKHIETHMVSITLETKCSFEKAISKKVMVTKFPQYIYFMVDLAVQSSFQTIQCQMVR
jgi:hypothetical protein